MKRYDGQVAVVTGASSGIGRRVARDLGFRGAIVVGVARRAELLEQLREQLRTTSSRSDTVAFDVTDAEAFRACLAEIEQRYCRIDVLINNAGIYESTPATEPCEQAYARLMATNFFAAVTSTYTVLPGMLRRGTGIIVNVSSDSARAPDARGGGYAASKAALATFSEGIDLEVRKRGVCVHVLYPAWVPTAMGLGDGTNPPPPKPVRRSEAQVSDLLLERMGGPRLNINASRLPLLALIARTTMPGLYTRAIQRIVSNE